MPAALTPRVRMMAVCDQIKESRREAEVFHLKGVRQGITAKSFPLLPTQLWLFMWLSSPRAGEHVCYIRVVSDRTDKTIFYAYLEPHPRFASDEIFVPGRSSIRCAIPEAGQYTIQVWFFQEDGNDVLKGEMPFFVHAEGGPQ